jgi:hypothetical protein
MEHVLLVVNAEWSSSHGENLHEHIFQIYAYYMKYEVLTEGNVKHTAFWNVTV